MRKWALLLLFTFILNTPVFAKLSPQGYLVIKEGSVKISRGRKDHYFSNLEEKIPVYKFDRIQTTVGTKARIHLNVNNDIVDLYSKTFFKIGPITKANSIVSMPIGKARFKVRKRRRSKRRFRLKTANAVIGVKGTEFVVGTDGVETNVLTLVGTVGLANIKTPEFEINIRVNEVSKAGQDTLPTRPVTTTPEQRKEILTKDSGKSFSNVKFGKVLVVKKQKKKAEKKKEEKKEEKKKGEKKKEEKKEKSTKKTNEKPVKKETSNKDGAAKSETDKAKPEKDKASIGQEGQKGNLPSEQGGEADDQGQEETPDAQLDGLPPVDEPVYEEIEDPVVEIPDPDDFIDPSEITQEATDNEIPEIIIIINH